jgi:cell division protein FtsZ
LFNITGGPDLSLYEVNQAAALIRDTAHPDANLIFGAVIDEKMGDEMRITVIATGFERMTPRHKIVPQQPTRAAAYNNNPPTGQPAREETPVAAQRPAEPVQPTFQPNNLDIPAFLRRR